MIKLAVDSSIFFFSFKSRSREVNPRDVERLLRKLSGDPRVELYVPITVLGESVIERLVGEKKDDGEHDLD
jgi:hypothetical protein